MKTHPERIELNSYLDDELAPSIHEDIASHLISCEECRSVVDQNMHVSLIVRSSCPEDASFTNAGQFWAGLVSRLQNKRPQTWPMLSVVPPIVLGALGILANLLLGLVIVVFALTIRGVLPPAGETITSGMAQAFSEGSPVITLATDLGVDGEQLATDITARWQGLGTVVQEVIVAGGVILLIGCVLAVAVVLYGLWALSWGKQPRPERLGGTRHGLWTNL